MENVIGESAARDLLNTLRKTELLGLVFSSPKIKKYTPVQDELAKWRGIECPIFQFEGEKLFELLLIAYKKIHGIDLVDSGLNCLELEYLKNGIDDLSFKLPIYIHELGEVISNYLRIISSKETLIQTQKHIKMFVDSLEKFKKTKEDWFSQEYQIYWDIAKNDDWEKRTNEECMRKALFQIPTGYNDHLFFFDRRFFFKRYLVSDDGEKNEYFLPLNGFFYEIIKSKHPTLVDDLKETSHNMNQRIGRESERSKICQKLMIHHAANKHGIFLGERIAIQKSICFNGDVPSKIEKNSNILYWSNRIKGKITTDILFSYIDSPLMMKYPEIDAVLVNRKNGRHNVSFMLMTTIDEQALETKLFNIQELIQQASKPNQDLSHNIFKKWMKALAFSGFIPENTEFDYWVIYEGKNEWRTNSRFSEYFKYLTFDAKDSSNLLAFLNCKSRQEYEKYAEKINNF